MHSFLATTNDKIIGSVNWQQNIKNVSRKRFHIDEPRCTFTHKVALILHTHTHAFSFQHTQADTRSRAHTVMRERTCTHHIPQTTNGRGGGDEEGR